MLHVEIIDFVKKAIKVRETLMENNISKLDEHVTKQKIENLKLLIKAYGYSSDIKASNFILQHVTEIRSFLPGPSSIAYNSFQKKLDELLNRAQSIVNEPAERC